MTLLGEDGIVYPILNERVIHMNQTKRTERLDWEITQKSSWIATHKSSRDILVAGTKAELMSKINKWDSENQSKISGVAK